MFSVVGPEVLQFRWEVLLVLIFVYDGCTVEDGPAFTDRHHMTSAFPQPECC